MNKILNTNNIKLWLKKKIVTNKEIDLVELIHLLYKNKLTIIIFIILSMVLMIVNLSLKKEIEPLFQSKTEIRSISTYDEIDYEIYNNFVLNSGSIIVKNQFKNNTGIITVNEVVLDLKKSSSFKVIDKIYLLNLFIEKINDRDFIIKTMREFELVDDNKINSYADSFDLSINSEPKEKDTIFENISLFISFKTKNIDKWKDYLIYLEKETNNEVRKYIHTALQNSVKSQKEIIKNKIVDINLEIENSTDQFIKDRLLLARQILLKNQYFDRLLISFNTTPILNENEFVAANILTNTTSYKNLSARTDISVPMMVIIAIVLGTIIGLFFVIISNSIKNRK